MTGVRRGSPGWLAAGVAVTVAVLGTTGFSMWYRIAGKPPVHTQVQTATYAGQASRITVDLTSGDITVTRGPAGRVSVTRRLQWSGRKPAVDEHWTGHDLRVSQDCPTGPASQTCNVSYTLAVPAGVTVTAATDSGNVRVSGIAGALSLSSQSGSITVSDPAGPLTAQTASGDVLVTGARSSGVLAKSDSGDVDLGFTAAPGQVSGDSAAGDVTVTVPPGTSYDVLADAASGDVTMTVHQDIRSSRSISADSASGDVTVRYG